MKIKFARPLLMACLMASTVMVFSALAKSQLESAKPIWSARISASNRNLVVLKVDATSCNSHYIFGNIKCLLAYDNAAGKEVGRVTVPFGDEVQGGQVREKSFAITIPNVTQVRELSTQVAGLNMSYQRRVIGQQFQPVEEVVLQRERINRPVEKVVLQKDQINRTTVKTHE